MQFSTKRIFVLKFILDKMIRSVRNDCKNISVDSKFIPKNGRYRRDSYDVMCTVHFVGIFLHQNILTVFAYIIKF